MVYVHKLACATSVSEFAMLIRRLMMFLPSGSPRSRVYLNRREFMLGAACCWPAMPQAALAARKEPLSTSEQPNHLLPSRATTISEFGTDKADPAAHSGGFQPRRPAVAGGGRRRSSRAFRSRRADEAGAAGRRIYRLRCVEGWSMVIPWVGFPLASLLQK